MSRRRLILLFLVLEVSMLYSCSSSDSSYIESGFMADTVSFPISLKHLSNGVLSPPDSALGKLKGKKKIVSIVDGVCMKCVFNDLNHADLAFQKLFVADDKNQVVFILNVLPEDSAFFRKHFESGIDVKGVILWDGSYDFEKSNKLLNPDKKYRTFLLDEENRIVLIGNPLSDPKLTEKYDAILQEKVR